MNNETISKIDSYLLNLLQHMAENDEPCLGAVEGCELFDDSILYVLENGTIRASITKNGIQHEIVMLPN